MAKSIHLLTFTSDAFNAYAATTGAVEDQTTGLLTVTTVQYVALESLFFTIDDVRDFGIYTRHSGCSITYTIGFIHDRSNTSSRKMLKFGHDQEILRKFEKNRNLIRTQLNTAIGGDANKI